MMKRNRLIFYSAFGALHFFIFFFSLYTDSQKDNLQFLLGMQSKIWMLKYGSFILLILMVINVVLHYRDNRRNTKEKGQLTHELNILKAKVYDFQEASKSKPSSTQAPQ
jgi:hypothetical protein